MADEPNQKWVSDITYIHTKEGWLYLAGVMDLYGGRLVGWAMTNHMRTELVSAALNQAIGRTGAKKRLIGSLRQRYSICKQGLSEIA